MKILVAGAGSIGWRHAGIVTRIADTGIVDIDQEKAKDCASATGAACFTDLKAALAWQPHAAIIAVPHDQHVPVAEQLVNSGVKVLIEKPVSDSVADAGRLLRLAEDKNVRIHVACNMRFHPGVSSIRNSLHAIGKPLFARASFGNWLPNMRPEVDYRQLYCASSSQGGVLLDGIHELDYLIWLLGDVTDSHIQTDRLSELEIKAGDYAALLLRHSSGARSEIHLDYLQQIKRRGCEIIGTEGTLVWESTGKSPELCRVLLYEKGRIDASVIFESADVDGNRPYEIQLEHFMKFLSGEKAPDLLTGEEALKELEIIRSHTVMDSKVPKTLFSA